MKLILAILLCAGAQDKIELKFRPKQGDKLKTTDATVVKIKGKMTSSGGEEQKYIIEEQSSRKSTREVAEASDGKVTKLIYESEEDITTTKEDQREAKRKEGKLHGKKVTVSLKDGERVFDGIERPDRDTKRVLRLDEPFAHAFPKKPVSVGDSWEVTGEDLKRLFDDEGKDGKVTLKLTAVKEIDQRKCAVLDVAVEIKGKTDDGTDMEMKLTGELIVWIERGYTLSLKLKGTLTMSGEGPELKFTADGAITLDIETKP